MGDDPECPVPEPLGQGALVVRFDRPRYAVIPTRNRPEVLMGCVQSIQPQVDEVIVINNGDSPLRELPHSVIEFRNPMQPVNLSRLWNQGLDLAARRATGILRKVESDRRPTEWDVAILNDDTVIELDWFSTVVTGMRTMGAVAGCTGPVPKPVLHTKAQPVSLFYRLQGWAFVLAGEKRIRADEKLLWWCGDDDLDWTSRENGGTAMVPGPAARHILPNGSFTPELHEQAGKDMATFVAKWGIRPW